MSRVLLRPSTLLLPTAYSPRTLPMPLSRRPAAFALVIVHLVALTACGQQKYQGGTATEPEARDNDFWKSLHSQFLDRAKQGDIDLLFVGDSITQGWNTNEAWKRHYGPRKAANFGIGGD